MLGTIQNLIANADGKTPSGGFDGIIGNVEATRILSASIGDGVLPSGTGAISFAGIYATGKIGAVVGGNIFGNVLSLDADSNVNKTPAFITSGIDSISISGSIVNAFIGTIGGFGEAQGINGGGLVIPVVSRVLNAAPFDIGSINITGNGGIIGSLIAGYNTGPITVGSRGFGILNTDVFSVTNGHTSTITAGGYGLRGITITGGDDLDGLVATGKGGLASTADYSADVRPSEVTTINPFFGGPNTILNDLDVALGVSGAAPVVAGVTDTGVIQDVVAQGAGTFGLLSAATVRTSVQEFVPTPLPFKAQAIIPVVGQTYSMSLAFGAAVNSVRVKGIIDGLQITTGHLGTFSPNGSVSRLGISVAGTINSLVIRGNLGQTITDPSTGQPIPDSYVQATGPSGLIRSLKISGNLYANVTANASLTRMVVGGNVIGNIVVNGQSNRTALGYFLIGGNLGNGTLTVHGSAGTIIASGGLGSLGGLLTVEGNLNLLTVGGQHHKLANNALSLGLHVEGTLRKLNVFGRVDGAITVDQDLLSMKVVSDGSGGNILNSNMVVGGRIFSASFVGGNVNADVTANGVIKSFNIASGNFIAGHTITSQHDAIQSFKITGGAQFGLLGSLVSPGGMNGSIDVSGNFGDGVSAATISSLSGNKYHIRGSIFANTHITVAGTLGTLQVDGNVSSGAFVSAHPLQKVKIGGTNLGVITAS